MNKTRNLRRHLTKRYQNKQKRLYDQYWGSWDGRRSADPKTVGYWRKHSWKDCGNSRCSMCDNPRRVGWLNNFEKQTIQERRFSYNLDEQLNEYNASE